MDSVGIRLAAFTWLQEQVDIHGDVLPRSLLAKGFIFENQRIPLVSPQGIHKPRQLDIPLTITTAPDGPYDDSAGNGGLFYYKYRGTDPNHRDNVVLRKAMKANIPLIYFLGVVTGKYLAVWPVYIVGDDPANHTFTVAVEDATVLQYPENSRESLAVSEDSGNARRLYLTTTVRKRLHQRSFRERVQRAYREQCALCRLRHLALLDAAHIIPDNDPDSQPTVNNGIALCKLHHAAFDSLLLTIRPDYRIEVREDILSEEDGPMLQHGLKEMHQSRIMLPPSRKQWPNQEYLERRYERFKSAI